MYKKTAYIFVGIIILLICYNLLIQIYDAFKASDRLNQAADDLYKLENQNRQLKKRLAEVKSQEFIEQEARDKLGFTRAGETVVIIPQSEINKVLGAGQKVERIEIPNWLGWWKVFFK